jgi:hypothetical protein
MERDTSGAKKEDDARKRESMITRKESQKTLTKIHFKTEVWYVRYSQQAVRRTVQIYFRRVN